MPLEVEQKFAVADLARLRQKLVALGAHFDEPIDQADSYLAHPSRDFAQTDEALRLRQVGPLVYITYKGPKLDGLTKTRREIEIPLPERDLIFQQFSELFHALGFTPVATVRKRRQPGHLVWRGTPVEIALDDVAGVGTFAEIELIAEPANLESARQSVLSLAEELELQNPQRRSYLELLLDKTS